jgi:hypothetical protein
MRFEIVGVMRGTVATDEPLGVRNVGQGGALVEAPWPLSENSVHTVRLEIESTLAVLDARVCHVSRPERAGSYLIGFEFIADDPPALEGLQALLTPADIDA